VKEVVKSSYATFKLTLRSLLPSAFCLYSVEYFIFKKYLRILKPSSALIKKIFIEKEG
jgi:hypothetical protein